MAVVAIEVAGAFARWLLLNLDVVLDAVTKVSLATFAALVALQVAANALRTVAWVMCVRAAGARTLMVLTAVGFHLRAVQAQIVYLLTTATGAPVPFGPGLSPVGHDGVLREHGAFARVAGGGVVLMLSAVVAGVMYLAFALLLARSTRRVAAEQLRWRGSALARLRQVPRGVGQERPTTSVRSSCELDASGGDALARMT